jgi:hypothetical protein
MATNKPQVIMDISQDPYQLVGRLGISNGVGTSPRININSIVGADLKRLDMPHMLEVLRAVYERKDSKLVYRPRAFRARTQAGTLTDIQASMYKRFQADQEEINNLLDLITPLIPDADKENCDAIRELVRDDVKELVEEAGWLGGPRKIKMDQAIQKCKERMVELRDLFGLDESRINTSAEAENWSRIITIDEILTSMKASYISINKYLDRSGSESFGNQVVWLSRCLATLKETSVRLQFLLRARYVGVEELATKVIPDKRITIAELLDWTAEVCDKGSIIGTKAGKTGMRSLATDLDNLSKVYKLLLLKAKTPPIEIKEVYDKQVQKTIKATIDAIKEAIKYAKPDLPRFTSISPHIGQANKKMKVYVYGDNLDKFDLAKLELQLKSETKNIVKSGVPTLTKNKKAIYFVINIGNDDGLHELRILNNGEIIHKEENLFHVIA